MRYNKNAVKSIRGLFGIGASVIAVILCTVYILDIIFGFGAKKLDGECEFHFIDVGQGDCTMIITDKNVVVIDAGPNDSAEDTQEYISEYTDKIDYLILTHPHEDHIGGADEILDNIKVKNVIMSDAASETYTFNVLLDAIERSGCNIIEGKAGDTYSAGDIKMTILAPISTFTDMNDYSLVTKVEYKNTSAMITGDVEVHSEELIVAEYSAKALKADILKMGHHGSSTSNSAAFLDSVDPSYAVFTCGKDNSYGHPHREVLKKVKDRSITYYRTDEDGSVVFHSDGEKIEFSTQ